MNIEDFPNEQWKIIEGSDTDYISNYGRCKGMRHGKLKVVRPILTTPVILPSKHIYNKRGKKILHFDYYIYKIRFRNKFSNRGAHNLVADHFLQKFILDGSGRYNSSKRVEFKDNNPLNIHVDNLKYTLNKNIFRNKKRREFPHGTLNIIQQIRDNTNEQNKDDNECIVKWLQGDSNAIGRLIYKYDDFYKFKLNWILSKIKRSKRLIKEAAITLDDIIIDANIKIMGKIKKGRFDGRNYKGWSGIVIKNYFLTHLKKQKEAEMQDVVEKGYF